MYGSRDRNLIMKRILYLLLLVVLVLAGCAQEVDLSEINNRLDKLEQTPKHIICRFEGCSASMRA